MSENTANNSNEEIIGENDMINFHGKMMTPQQLIDMRNPIDETIEKGPKPVTLNNPYGQDYTITWNIEGVDFGASAEDFIRLMKLDHEYTWDTFLEECCYNEFEHNEFFNIDEYKAIWDSNPAYTAQECIEKYHGNSAQMMVVFKLMGAEKMFIQLGGEVVSEEVFHKRKEISVFANENLNFEDFKNMETIDPSMLTKTVREYDDTYTLIRCTKEQHKIETVDDDLYIIKCACPSTNKEYYLFVDGNDEQCKTAFGAIAWTMRDEEGGPLTIEQWKEIEAEA